jgi:hypothetical protein
MEGAAGGDPPAGGAGFPAWANAGEVIRTAANATRAAKKRIMSNPGKNPFCVTPER